MGVRPPETQNVDPLKIPEKLHFYFIRGLKMAFTLGKMALFGPPY